MGEFTGSIALKEASLNGHWHLYDFDVQEGDRKFVLSARRKDQTSEWEFATRGNGDFNSVPPVPEEMVASVRALIDQKILDFRTGLPKDLQEYKDHLLSRSDGQPLDFRGKRGSLIDVGNDGTVDIAEWTTRAGVQVSILSIVHEKPDPQRTGVLTYLQVFDGLPNILQARAEDAVKRSSANPTLLSNCQYCGDDGDAGQDFVCEDSATKTQYEVSARGRTATNKGEPIIDSVMSIKGSALRSYSPAAWNDSDACWDDICDRYWGTLDCDLSRVRDVRFSPGEMGKIKQAEQSALRSLSAFARDVSSPKLDLRLEVVFHEYASQDRRAKPMQEFHIFRAGNGTPIFSVTVYHGLYIEVDRSLEMAYQRVNFPPSYTFVGAKEYPRMDRRVQKALLTLVGTAARQNRLVKRRVIDGQPQKGKGTAPGL